jgi:selenocysteine lyase/cysteine desulfurase
MRPEELRPEELWTPEPGFLNTASYGLPPRPALAAVQVMLDDWRAGRTSWEPWDRSVDLARERFARLIGVPAADVAVGATVSELLGLVAAALPGGARVVVPDCEFTSNLFPWLVQADRGVEVVTVPLDRVADAIDDRTTLVAFSLVQSASGEVAPAAGITAAARQHGALVAVDATQACGWLPVDATAFDVLVAHAYKWLMAPRGSSFLYVRPSLAERMRPVSASWYAGADRGSSYYGPPLRLAGDARRFDTSPAWLSWIGTAPALEVIEQIGVPVIHDHNVRLANRLRAGLGLPPGDSAIVSADIPGAEAKLARAGIRASARAGRTRLACHIYTTEQDVDAALSALAGLNDPGDPADLGDTDLAGRDA